MTLCKVAGLADPSAQLYMLFYYAGPGFLIFTILYIFLIRDYAIEVNKKIKDIEKKKKDIKKKEKYNKKLKDDNERIKKW